MKIILGSVLALAIAGTPLLPGQEPDDKDKPKQEQPKKEPKPKQDPKPDDKPKPKPKQEPKQEPAPPPKQPSEKEKEKPQKEQAKQDNKRQQQEPSARQDTRTSQTHGKGRRIPPEKFQANFGAAHHFRVHRLQDNRRFQYSGFWFEVVEVWPSDWSYDDDCYIEEDGDDYYLIDVVHPGVRVLVVVVEV